MITVLIVDDHEIVRLGIRAAVQSMPDISVVGEASNGLEALKQIKTLSPRIVLMDIEMPVMGGLETTRRIMLYDPSIKIIIFSAHEDEIYASRLLELGVSGYIIKDASSREIFMAIHSVLKGMPYICTKIAHQIALTRIQNREHSIFDCLSFRELQIALMIVEGKSLKDISRSFYISSRTTQAYRQQIFKKLNIDNDVQLILLAKQAGLLTKA